MRILPALLALLLYGNGCGASGLTVSPPAPKAGGTVLTGAELSSFQDAGQAVRVLRRHWVAKEQRTPTSVFVDGVLTPGVETLSLLPTYQVLEIRYLRPIEASVRFGGDHRSGALVVVTRRSRA